jgi:hypothetical protein
MHRRGGQGGQHRRAGDASYLCVCDGGVRVCVCVHVIACVCVVCVTVGVESGCEREYVTVSVRV